MDSATAGRRQGRGKGRQFTRLVLDQNDGPHSSTAQSVAFGAGARGDAKTDLLTPDGIRRAVKEIKAATGTDRACDLTVYPNYVSAEIMIKGSDTKYDSYTYRPGQGVQKGIISSALIGGERPFSLDDFNWDVLPAF